MDVPHESLRTRVRPGLRYPGILSLFLAWTLIGSLSYAHHLMQSPTAHASFRDFAGWLVCYYPWILLAPLVFRLEQRFPLNLKNWKFSVPILLSVGVPFTLVAMKCSELVDALMARSFHFHTFLHSVNWGEFGFAFVLFCSITIIGAVIRTIISLERQQRIAAELALENAKLEACLKNAELETLRLRLKPHFLFNTLENISSLAEEDPRLARKMLARLGELLRAAFRRDYQSEINLNAEIALMNAYLDVERIRFGERLCIHLDIDPETETALVPSLLLQPLVENAIQHGLRGVSGIGKIEVASQRNLQHLILTVKDNGNGPPHDSLDSLSLGVGLGSTRERLMRMYPENHQLSVEKLQNGGTLVHIQLPFHTRNATPHSSVAYSYRG